MNSEFTVTFEVLPHANKQIIIKLCNIVIINERMLNINTNHKNYNFLNYEWFRRLLLPTNSLVVIGQFVIEQLVIGQDWLSDSSTNQSHSKL